MKSIKKDECSYSVSNAIRTLVMVRITGVENAKVSFTDFHELILSLFVNGF